MDFYITEVKSRRKNAHLLELPHKRRLSRLDLRPEAGKRQPFLAGRGTMAGSRGSSRSRRRDGLDEAGARREVGYVGTPPKIGAYEELGTGRIPPRPFLSSAAMASEPEIEKMAAKMVAAAIERRGSEWLELLHLAKEAAHTIKETIEEVLETPEDEKRKKR